MSSEFKTLISAGDDGFVYKITEGSVDMALKVFRLLPDSSQMKQEIVKDQASRELLALNIIRTHDNIVRPISKDIEAVNEEIEGRQHFNTFGFRMEYIPDLYSLNDVTFGWGYEPAISTNRNKKPIMNFESRNMIVRHILSQIFDVLLCLQTHNIRHRDLDYVNVKIVPKMMCLKVLDFARSDVPGKENPDNIVVTATQEIEKPDVSPETKEDWEYCKKAYENPVNSIIHTVEDNLPTGIEYSDTMAFKSVIRSVLTRHINKDFDWIRQTDAKEVVNENLMLMYFTRMVWFQDDFEKLKSKFKVTDIHKHLSYFSSEQCGKVLKNKNFKSQDQSNFDHLSVKRTHPAPLHALHALSRPPRLRPAG